MGWRQFLLTFEGRISRQTFWKRFVLPFAILNVIVVFAAPPVPGFVYVGAFWLASLWPCIAVVAKRCHDRNWSGWYQLIALIPYVGALWLLIDLGFLKGTSGPNRFGPDPLGCRR